MKRGLRQFFFVVIILFLAACSSNSEDKAGMDKAMSNDSDGMVAMSEEATESQEKENSNVTVNRMVIYNANLKMRVNNYQAAERDLELKAKKYGGFIIESTSFRDENKQMNGTLTLRIPEEHFQSFLHDAEGTAEEVLERNVSGQDVTEEYVDLESRLRSKRVVEERLLEFMKNAGKTEDLLKISDDLAIVQEEIERVLGRMKYLENQTSYSTISITLQEEKVIVPNLEQGDLNTWERTKKQFVTSTNFLLSAFSGVFVFIVGNLPVLLLLSIFIFFLFLAVKRGRHKQINKE